MTTQMGQARRLELGKPVACRDGAFGEIADFVIEPGGRRVTHLVVESRLRSGQARLVPVDLAEQEEGSTDISLRCTIEHAHGLTSVHELAYLRLGRFPIEDEDWDVGVKDVLATPHYDAGALVEYQPDPDPNIMMIYDRVPKGEVEIRSLSSVSTADGHDAGRVSGFLVNGGAITHLVLHRGYLWRRHELHVPEEAIEALGTDSVTLHLTKAQLKAVPRVRLGRGR